MPGNELGDGVHNFFVQDHPLQGQQQSQVAEGSWPVLNSSFPAGAGSGEYPFFLTHGSPLTQSGVRPTEQSIMNGFVYGNHSHQTTQNAGNSDQRHTSSAGFSFHELQQRGHDTNAPVSSETSVSPVSFDFFGGQLQMSHQQSNMTHFLQPRQSVINDPQQLQQQLMIRKFQEIQRQQLVSRQEYSINQAPSLAKHSSGGQSTLVNGTSNSNNFQNPLSAEYDANRLHQVSPRMQASFNGLPFQLNTGQTQSSVNLMPQQFDQSLYGFPVSNSRGLPETQYPQMMADSYLMPQPQIAIASSSSLHGNQNNLLTNHGGIPDESSVFRHKFHSQNNVEVSLNQSVNTGVKSSIAHQLVNSMSRNVAPQAFNGKQELTFHPETSRAKSTAHVSSPTSEVALDPEEEKILFGSDDNIWSAFGNVPHISGESGKMIGNGGLFDGLPSTQSGSWSALMQSAVAETSGNDAIVQEQSSKFFRSNEDGLSARQMSSVHNDTAEKANSSTDNNVRMQSTFSSGSFAADKVEVANSMVFNQSGNMIQHEPGHGVHIETPYSSVQSLKEAGFRFCSNPLKTSGASQHHNQPQSDTKRMMSEHSGTGIHSSWKNVAAVPPGIDRLSNHDAQNLKQSSQNIQDSLMLGQISSSWERNSLLGHTDESVRVKSDGFNLGSKGLDDASVANPNGTKRSFNTSPFVQSNSPFNQWRSAVSPATSLEAKSSDSLLKQTNKHNQISDLTTKGDEYGSAKHEAGKSNKDNTSDSHFSNLSHHMSHGSRERGSTITNDPRFPTSAKQKPANQFHNKGSASRKFLYHPMGNVDEDVETSHKLQPSVSFSTVADGSATLGKGENSLNKMPGSISSGLISGIHSSKSHLHDKKSSKPVIEKSINPFNDLFNGNSSLNTQRRSIEARLPDVSSSDRQNNLAASDIPEQIGRNDFQEEIPSATVPLKDHERTSQHFVMPGNPQQRDSAKMLFNIWSSAPMHRNSGQGQLLPSQPDSPYHNILESSSTPMQHFEECKSKESISQHSDSVGTDHVPKIEESSGKESSMKNPMDNSPTKATSVLKEIEDFGRYLRPNNFSDQTYLLSNQTQVLKDKSGDSKITDRPDNIADGTPASWKAGNQGSSKIVMSPDSKMMSSSEPVDVVPRITSQCGISQNDSGLNPSVSQSHTYVESATFPTVERRQVSLQMAPTWFSAPGSSKSGQMIQIYNAHKLSQVRPGEPPLPTGNSTIGLNALNLEGKGTDGTPGASVINGHCSSSLPQLNVTGQNIVPLRQKKRKNATFGPQPWHKEISDDSRFLGILSMAEPDSSKAANRGDGVAETTEDANSVLRSKRRLIMSSHLMQQLIRPPPPVIPLSGDASTSYDVVAYSVSRIALGDACHAVSYANSLEGACSSMNLPLETHESPMKTSAQAYEEAAQELIGKVTKLENDLSRHEKSASLLDLRVECQELEKFSIINRFARFHGRPKNDSSETTASANAIVGAQKFLTLRYVNAVAMPRNLPETLNCLQL